MQHTRLVGRLATATVLIATTACGSQPVDERAGASGPASDVGTSTSAAPTSTSAAPTPALTADERLVAEALLEPADAGEDWEQVSEAFFFPNSAELARPIAECQPYAEVAFQGGEQHGVGTSSAISYRQNVVFLYVAVFPTVEMASAMLDAVSSEGFDECWARFNEAAVLNMSMPITNPRYSPEPPPDFTFDADAWSVKYLVGTVEFGGAETTDTCVCIFARVGRAVVEVHSTEPTLTPEKRVALAQLAIDKTRRTLAAEG
jgi:hypothetical protein